MGYRILFAPFGSEGDINPLLWLAGGLAARGHHPVILLSPHYGRLADRRGIPWIPVGKEEDFLRIARNPRLMHAHLGPMQVMKLLIESLPAYRDAFRQAGPGFDLVVTSSFALAASSLAEAEKIPRLTLHLQPICLRSEKDSPLFHPALFWLNSTPGWSKRLFYHGVDFILWRLVEKSLNQFRAGLGLPPLRHFYEEAVNGADALAALFPDWFAPPQPDWPAHLRQFGFPVPDAPQTLPLDLENFLASGPPPVIWTHGSANFDIRHFHDRALAVSHELGLRCLLVSLDPPAGPLPPHAFHASHVRFDDLFPRCAAVVHHGGIGTTSKAIAAAVPQLIIPRSHDQPDNAARIVKLGLGRTLSYRKLNTPALARCLRDVLASPAIKARCLEFQNRLTDPLPSLCNWAESLARRT